MTREPYGGDERLVQKAAESLPVCHAVEFRLRFGAGEGVLARPEEWEFLRSC